MKQKFNKTSHNISYWYARHARSTFLATSVVFSFSFMVYMFFTVSSLSSGVAFQHITSQIKSTESRIADLEAGRIARMKSVDLSFARDRGFIEVSPTRYISKNQSTERFSLRTVR